MNRILFYFCLTIVLPWQVWGANKLDIYTLNFGKCWVKVHETQLAVSDFSNAQAYVMNYVEFANNYLGQLYPGQNVQLLETAIDCSGYGHHIILKVQHEDVTDCVWLLYRKNKWLTSAKGKAREKTGVCEPEGAVVNPGDIFTLPNPGTY
jgi:hypothetical protein